MPLVLLAAAAAVASLPNPDPIVVTASRTPVSEVLSGTAISVIDTSEIEALKLPLVSDYLRLVPSVAVATSGALGTQTQVRIRGAESRHTLVFVDGIEANDPASSSEFRFETLLADGVNSIEVLRGPQSALWGAQAIGGVINVINRAPPVGTEAYGQAEGGSFGTFRAGAGGGWGNDAGGLAAQANYLTSRGYDISATPGGNKNGYSNLSLSAKGFYRITPTLEVGAVGRYSDANSQFDDFDYVRGVSLDARLSTGVRTVAGRGYATLKLFDARWTHTVEVAATDAANVNRDAGRVPKSQRRQPPQVRLPDQRHGKHRRPEPPADAGGRARAPDLRQHRCRSRRLIQPAPRPRQDRGDRRVPGRTPRTARRGA